MPSSAELPSLPELLNAFHASVGSEQKTEDAHLGSFYDRMAGVGALCMRTLAERDQGEARAIFFDTATDGQLDQYIEGRGYAERVQDTFGTGVASLSLPFPTLGDLIYKGTRFSATRGAGDSPRYWVSTADVSVPSGSSTARVPIEATVPGAAGQISIASGQGATLSIVDRMLGTGWQIDRIDCGPGTSRQRDPEVRAVIRQDAKDRRPGYPTAIINAMIAAGASVVALYQSDYLGDAADYGLNRIYVGDSGYETPASLLATCRLAVPKVAVAGTAVQVLPITSVTLYPTVTVRLWASPERLNQLQAQSDSKAAVLEYFARRDNAFLWSEAGIRSAVMRVVKNVHSVVVSAKIMGLDGGGNPGLVPAAEPDLTTLFNVSPLPRYSTSDWATTVSVLGPS